MSTINIGKYYEDDKPGAGVVLDVPRLTVSRAFIAADSGGGKSYLLRRMLEQISKSTQTIVIDPEGEFASLREKRDMVLAGPQGDVPAEPRSAALLCRRLMELNLSAVLDISELKMDDRQTFVANFCNTMVDLPRKLWRPCAVAIDEIHEFSPENVKSASGDAVALLSSKGRKRGFFLLGATQRLAKTNNNVIAGIKNNFFGTFSLDADIKRAAGILGFARERWPEIRDLSSREGFEGEYFAFGPAFNRRGVNKMRGGAVETTHPEAGRGKIAPPEPSAKIASVLGEIKDLSTQAEQEIKDLAGAKARIAELEREARKNKVVSIPATSKPNPKQAEQIQQLQQGVRSQQQTITQLRKALKEAVNIMAKAEQLTAAVAIDRAQVKQLLDNASSQMTTIINAVGDKLVKHLESAGTKDRGAIDRFKREATIAVDRLKSLLDSTPATAASTALVVSLAPIDVPATNSFGAGEISAGMDATASVSEPKDPAGREELDGPQKRVIDALAFWEAIGVKEPCNSAVAIKAIYTPNSNSYEKPRGALRQMQMLTYPKPDLVSLTDAGRARACYPMNLGTLAQFHAAVLSILAGPEQKILKLLIKAYPQAISNKDLAEGSGYSDGSNSYEKPRGKLRGIGLAEYRDGGVAASAILFPERLLQAST